MKLTRSLQSHVKSATRKLREIGWFPAAARLERPAPRNVLLLGGSNTVIRNGYAASLIACLTERYGPLGQVANLAVGANSIVHGLMIAKAQPNLSEYDLVIVEYGVNDVRLARTGSMPVWRGAAEGLIRYLLADRPDRQILFAQFSRRAMKDSQFLPARELEDLAARYGLTHRVSAVDVDGLFRRVLFPDRATFNGLFADAAHWSRPVVASMIGALLAAEIAAAPMRAAPRRLPPPVHRWNFQRAALVDLVPDRSTAEPAFMNSRFRLPVRRVPVGESVTVDLPGPLIGVEFVATEMAATLRATEGGARAFALHTRHIKTGTKAFPFLLKFAPVTWRAWDKGPKRGSRSLLIEAAADADPQEIRPTTSMAAAEPGNAQALYLTRALCAV